MRYAGLIVSLSTLAAFLGAWLGCEAWYSRLNVNTRQDIYEATSAAIRLEVRHALDSYFAAPSKGEPYAHP